MSFYPLKMMMARLNLFFAAGFLWLAAMNFGGAARAANFTASLNPETITLGESSTLTLKFEGGAPKELPPLNVSGLQVSYASGPLHFESSFNGQVTSASDSYTFTVTPQKTGEFVIPAMTVNIGGQPTASTAQKLTVTQPHPPTAADINSGSQFAFVKLTLPKTNLYAGEVIAADLQIYIRQDVQLVQIPNYNNPQITSLPVEGFSTGKIPSGNVSQTRVGNTIYNVIPAKIALTAIKPGPLSIGPIAVGMVLEIPSENQPTRSFGGFIFNFGGGEQKQISVATETIKGEALPLPVENVPPDFNGAVGDYNLALTVGPTNVPAGDPVTLRVQISGRGALDNVRLPDLSAWPDWKIFPPTSKIETADALGIEGTKSFEEIITPQNPDIRALPQFSFSFFNPADRNYHTLTNPPVPLAVRAGGATTAPTIAANKNSAAENQAPQDILPIKEHLGTPTTEAFPLISQPKFLVVQSLPVIAFLAAFIWRKRTDSLANNPRLRRQRAVAQLVSIGLNDLKKFAAENKPEEFFALLFRLLQEQLGERLDCPASAITENVVEDNSTLRGSPETTRTDLRELFQLCNQARYAPVRGSSELNSVAAQFEKTVGELQNLKA